MIKLKEKLKNPITVLLLLGIVVFLLGCIRPCKYEQAMESGCIVEATIVQVKKSETEGEGGFVIDTYKLYADYTFNGETYKHVKLKNYGSEGYVGQKVNIVVNPDTGKPMGEGGFLATIGFLIMAAAVVMKISEKKAKSKQPQ